MIFSILGGALVCAACGLFGLYMAHRGVVRARRLGEFGQSLMMLKSEIEFAACPLPQAFANISQKTSGSLAKFYEDLSRRLTGKEMGLAQAWKMGLTELRTANGRPYGGHWHTDDLQAVSGLGSALGSIDDVVQIKAINTSAAAIDDILARLTAQNAKDGKMYKRLGLLGGALITIVLL